MLRGRIIARWATHRVMLLSLLLLVVWGAGLSAPAEPQWWCRCQWISFHVCPQGCPFTSIQEAIDAAPEGAIIEVGPGTYRENLLIQKSLWIIGSGSDSTIIIQGAQGEWEPPVVRILGSSEEAFLQELQGERPAPTPRITVQLQMVRLLLKPSNYVGSCLLLDSYTIGNEVVCPAGLYVRGPVNLHLDEVEIAGLPELGGIGIIAEGSGWIMGHRVWIHDMEAGVVVNSRTSFLPPGGEPLKRPLELILSLSDSSIEPRKVEGSIKITEGIHFTWGQLVLHRSRVQGGDIGVWLINASATLVESQIVNNESGIAFRKKDDLAMGVLTLKLERNLIAHNRLGFIVTPSEAVQNVAVCEGNEFEENEEDLLVATLIGPDPEGTAELAHRCGVELGGQ
ncbi:MAG: hypothetical protein ACUVQU_07730 [Candidatus Bipolaricaulia bacterium]